MVFELFLLAVTSSFRGNKAHYPKKTVRAFSLSGFIKSKHRKYLHDLSDEIQSIVIVTVPAQILIHLPSPLCCA